MLPRIALIVPLFLGSFAVACAATPVPPSAIPPATEQTPMRIVMDSRGSPDRPVVVHADGAIERDKPLGKVSSDRVVNVMGQIVLQLLPDGSLQSPGEELSSSMNAQDELEGRGIKTSIDREARIVVATRYGNNVVGKVEGLRPDKRRTVLLVIAALPKLTKPSR